MNPTRPSRTALVVAKSQALVGMAPETAGLVPPEALRFVTTTLRICGRQRFTSRLRHPWFRRLVGLYERLMIPGLALHHVLRKQAVERIVRRELSAGANQVVQIGAGFDSLAHRLHRDFPNTDFLEGVLMYLDPSVTIRADNDANRIVATFKRKEDGEAIAALLEQVDIPHVSPPSRFVELDFIDAQTAANAVSEKFHGKDPGFNVIPDTGTNRVFLIGTIEQIDRASTMLAELDVSEAP